MILLETIAVAFGMYSALPMPRVEWNARNMRWALAAFPLVGAAQGALLALWGLFCGAFCPGALVQGAGILLVPVLATGGLHLDGFADTSDALASHAEPARKLEILRDSRIGAFAAIRLGCYFTAYFALAATLTLTPQAAARLTLVYLLERCLSGCSVALFPLAKQTGLAHAFATAAHRRRLGQLLAFAAALLAVGLLALGPLPGALVLLGAGLCFVGYHRLCLREFGGVSGDLAGWFLQMCELTALAALVLAQLLEGRLPL